ERSANRTVTVRRSSRLSSTASRRTAPSRGRRTPRALPASGSRPAAAAPRSAGAPGGEDPDAGPATASSALPHAGQKRACGGAGVPQAGQERSRAVPQEMQNRAPAGFSTAQLLQTDTL